MPLALQVFLQSLDAPLEQLSKLQLSAVEREVAGLLGAQVYHGKQLAPFADNQPMLITSLLLNAAACYLRDPSACTCGDPDFAPNDVLQLAVIAMVLQPGYGKAYYRIACALGRVGETLPAAHAIMRYAAQLYGTPAAELLAHLPPLPPGAVELPIFLAMTQLMMVKLNWPRLMRERAPVGQDFLLQLPGGLGELPPSLVFNRIVIGDAEAHVALALEAKERGNTAFAAGNVRAALNAYHSGIDSLRPLAARYLQRMETSISLDAQRCGAPSMHDPAKTMTAMRCLLLLFTYIELFPYLGRKLTVILMEETATMYKSCPPLPPATRLPGCKDMHFLIGSFWTQLVAKFMEPYGGAEGLLAHHDDWKHHLPAYYISPRFDPFGLDE
jgi:hypothetical protein